MNRCKIEIEKGKFILYIDNKSICDVEKRDYRNGYHGYAVKTVLGLSVFQNEANEKYSNMENPYISYLDYLIAQAIKNKKKV